MWPPSPWRGCPLLPGRWHPAPAPGSRPGFPQVPVSLTGRWGFPSTTAARERNTWGRLLNTSPEQNQLPGPGHPFLDSHMKIQQNGTNTRFPTRALSATLQMSYFTCLSFLPGTGLSEASRTAGSRMKLHPTAGAPALLASVLPRRPIPAPHCVGPQPEGEVGDAPPPGLPGGMNEFRFVQRSGHGES